MQRTATPCTPVRFRPEPPFLDLTNIGLRANDPGATSLVDQLIAAQPAGSGIANQLTELRELLDNFNFSDAEPLLAGLQRNLQGSS